MGGEEMVPSVKATREDAPHCMGDGRGASTTCTVQPPDGFFSSSSGLAGTAKSKRGMSADSYLSGDRSDPQVACGG